jgi:hypothetical protein
MLTIEQLRAMPAADVEGYLRQTHNQMRTDDREAMRAQRMAEEHESSARECRECAEHLSAKACEARAYFATLEAAGLWPLPPGPAKEQP